MSSVSLHILLLWFILTGTTCIFIGYRLVDLGSSSWVLNLERFMSLCSSILYFVYSLTSSKTCLRCFLRRTVPSSLSVVSFQVSSFHVAPMCRYLSHLSDLIFLFVYVLCMYCGVFPPCGNCWSHRNLERHATIELCLRNTSVYCSLLDNSQLNNYSAPRPLLCNYWCTRFNNRGRVFCVWAARRLYCITSSKWSHFQFSMSPARDSSVHASSTFKNQKTSYWFMCYKLWSELL
jgi:hypothetical protein